MKDRLAGMTESAKWKLMVSAATRGAAGTGCTLERVKGRGLSNVWNVTRDGKTYKASIRTTRDRWYAFVPLANGKKWKTLDDVDLVIVAAVDSPESPENIEVYVFPADEVRKRFRAAHAARVKNGWTPRDDFGFWVGLDKDPRDVAASVGTGIVDHYKPVATYSIEALLSEKSEPMPGSGDNEAIRESEAKLATISEVMAWARERVAKIAGVGINAVKLELKVEY
jgi:hypothetical protein